jgi:hypothetical protein
MSLPRSPHQEQPPAANPARRLFLVLFDTPAQEAATPTASPVGQVCPDPATGVQKTVATQNGFPPLQAVPSTTHDPAPLPTTPSPSIATTTSQGFPPPAATCPQAEDTTSQTRQVAHRDVNTVSRRPKRQVSCQPEVSKDSASPSPLAPLPPVRRLRVARRVPRRRDDCPPAANS